MAARTKRPGLSSRRGLSRSMYARAARLALAHLGLSTTILPLKVLPCMASTVMRGVGAHAEVGEVALVDGEDRAEVERIGDDEGRLLGLDEAAEHRVAAHDHAVERRLELERAGAVRPRSRPRACSRRAPGGARSRRRAQLGSSERRRAPARPRGPSSARFLRSDSSRASFSRLATFAVASADDEIGLGVGDADGTTSVASCVARLHRVAHLDARSCTMRPSTIVPTSA
jgi:hypothetical protein